jgi:large subunit ribosomal protein L28
MAKRCQLTGAEPRSGNNVSHAKNATKRRWIPNLRWKRVFLADENRWVRIRVTAAALRTISKNGLSLAKFK